MPTAKVPVRRSETAVGIESWTIACERIWLGLPTPISASLSSFLIVPQLIRLIATSSVRVHSVHVHCNVQLPVYLGIGTMRSSGVKTYLRPGVCFPAAACSEGIPTGSGRAIHPTAPWPVPDASWVDSSDHGC